MQNNAVRLVQHGRIEVVDTPVGAPGVDEVRIDMAFAAVNPVDIYAMQGRVAPDAPLPRTLGGEGSGFLGDQRVVVRGFGLGTTRDGTWAQEVVVPSAAVIPIPDGVGLREASAVGIAGATAIRCVEDLARIGPSDRVLVLGASGGVGSAITSLCAATGARVWAQTGSADKAEFAGELGAEHVIVGDAGEVALQIGALHPSVVFDPLGGDFSGASIAALEPAGQHIIFGTSAAPQGSMPLQELYRKGITIRGYAGLRDDADTLRRATARALEAVAGGRLTVSIDRQLPLPAVHEALARVATRGARGKVVLELD